MGPSINLAAAQRLAHPFDSFHTCEALDVDRADRVLSWLEAKAPWVLSIREFYQQFEFSLFEVALPTDIAFLTSRAGLEQLRGDIGTLLGADLEEKVDITAHKLVPGQRIRIHNDFVAGQETHRLLVQLNRSWSEANGGLLMLFCGSEPKSLSRIILPKNRSAFGFAISPQSYHAVTPILSGERYTLVYSFYERHDGT